jgi:hypothetical protein
MMVNQLWSLHFEGSKTPEQLIALTTMLLL